MNERLRDLVQKRIMLVSADSRAWQEISERLARRGGMAVVRGQAALGASDRVLENLIDRELIEMGIRT